MKTILSLFTVGLILSSCSHKMTFEEQIINDIETKIPSGVCDYLPKGTVLSNIKVGEIVDIGLQGMTDVTYEFDYEINGTKKHKTAALLYIKTGNTYELASLGGGCEYEMK